MYGIITRRRGLLNETQGFRTRTEIAKRALMCLLSVTLFQGGDIYIVRDFDKGRVLEAGGIILSFRAVLKIQIINPAYVL